MPETKQLIEIGVVAFLQVFIFTLGSRAGNRENYINGGVLSVFVGIFYWLSIGVASKYQGLPVGGLVFVISGTLGRVSGMWFSFNIIENGGVRKALKKFYESVTNSKIE